MKNILLPIDGSARSLRTIQMVKRTYTPAQVRLTILMVLPGQMHIDGELAIQRAKEKAQEDLAGFARMLEGYNVQTDFRRGSPGPEIVHYAQEKGFDTLIMTRSSRGPLRRLGAVATYVVKNAPTLDLFIMREAAEE